MSSEEVVVVDVDTNGSIENTKHSHQQVSDQPGLTGKKLSWQKLTRYDSLEMESRSFPTSTHASKVCIYLLFHSSHTHNCIGKPINYIHVYEKYYQYMVFNL